MNMVRQYYTAPALRNRIATALALLGKSEGDLTPDDLSPLDEFHLRGHLATAELIELLRAAPGRHILDAGAGLGGPARRLAHTTGCRVTGVDLSADFCDAGTYLNQRTGLTNLVSLVSGDVTDLSEFADSSFDGAWTMHVSMNIRDKAAFYGELARVVKTGGQFVSYDIFAAGSGEIHYPMPWAPDASTSFLATPDEIERELHGAGFLVRQSQDQTEAATALVARGLEQLGKHGVPQPLGLHLVLGPAFPDIVRNTARNLQEGRLRVVSIVAERAA